MKEEERVMEEDESRKIQKNNKKYDRRRGRSK